MDMRRNQCTYYTNMLILRDMVMAKLLTNKEANFVSVELAKDYGQEPVFLW